MSSLTVIQFWGHKTPQIFFYYSLGFRTSCFRREQRYHNQREYVFCAVVQSWYVSGVTTSSSSETSAFPFPPHSFFPSMFTRGFLSAWWSLWLTVHPPPSNLVSLSLNCVFVFQSLYTSWNKWKTHEQNSNIFFVYTLSWSTNMLFVLAICFYYRCLSLQKGPIIYQLISQSIS